MGIKKFWALSLEKKLLIIFLWICIALPFSMAKSPLEIVSHTIPIWINLYGGIGFWCASGKPLWQAFLACYGIASVGIMVIYFGTFGGQTLFVRFKNRLKARLEKGLIIPLKNLSLILRIEPGYQKFNSFTKRRKRRFTEWLGKQGVILILLVLLIPLPLSDIIATVAMEIKKVRYGLWYLLAVNLLHIYLVVFLIYEGKKLFFL